MRFYSRVAIAWALTVSPAFAINYGAYQLDGATVSGSSLTSLLPVGSAQRPPRATDDTTAGRAVGDTWLYGGSWYQNVQNTAGFSIWQKQPNPSLPCDALTTKACYGMQRLKASYGTGPAFDWTCSPAGTAINGTAVFLASGMPDYSAMDAACAGNTTNQAFTTTADMPSGSKVLTIASTAGMYPGQPVTSANANIPTSATIAAVSSSTTLTLSVANNGDVPSGSVGTILFTSVPRVTKWYDQSGNGYNATNTTAGSQPGISSQIMIGGVRALVFDNVARGTSGYPFIEQPNNVFLTMPAALTTAGQNVSLYSVGRLDSNSLSTTTVEVGQTSQYALDLGVSTQNNSGISSTQFAYASSVLVGAGPFIQGPAGYASTQTPEVLSCDYTSTGGITSQNLHIGTAAAPNGNATSYTGGEIGDGNGLNNVDSAGNKEGGANALTEVIVAAYQTPAVYQSTIQASMFAFGIPPQQRESIVLTGDSRTEGYGSNMLLNWPNQMVGLLPKSVSLMNTATWGDLEVNMNANFAYAVTPLYQPNAMTQIFINTGGYNDLANANYSNVTPAQEAATVYAATTAWVGKVHALGHNTVAIVATATIAGTFDATHVSAFTAYNNLVRAGAVASEIPVSQASSTSYVVADLASDPTINSAANMASASIYSPDNVHWTNLMDAYVAQDIAAALAPYL